MEAETDAGKRQTMRAVAGWDIGGANLKVTLARGGRVVMSQEARCPLWQGMAELDKAFDALLAYLPGDVRHVVTMTGELTDLFEGRRAGVLAIAAKARERLGEGLLFWAGRSGWVAPVAVEEFWADIASANWFATASLVARRLDEALLLDIGSTTTDVIPVRHGMPAATGYSDAERLGTGELVYLGATRTPLMALAAEIPVAGRKLAVMAEYFATIADVHTLLGVLPEGVVPYGTADNGGIDAEACRRRIARQVGCDAADFALDDWLGVAAAFREAALRRIHDGVFLALSAMSLSVNAPVVLCGIGAFLGEEVARRLGRPVTFLASLIPAESAQAAGDAAHFAPSAAVALLAENLGG